MRIINSFFLTLIASTIALSGCTKKSDEIKNEINLALGANVKGLDPVSVTDVYTNDVISNIYEPLLQYNYLKRPLVLEPSLAAALPTVSKDGLVHTFKIKQGAKFQDDKAFPDGKGRQVTSKDFIYAWKRMADPKNQSESFWVFDGRIKGLNEWRDQATKGNADYDANIEGLKAPDDETLVITLTKPFYQLHYVLAMVITAPVAKEAVDKYGKEFLNNPVGTGPYKLESWTRNSKIVLVKNPTWHGGTYPTEGEATDKENGFLEDAGKPLPLNDKITFHEIIEDQPRWLNFMKGDLDVVSIPKDNFDAAVKGKTLSKDLSDKGIHLLISEEPDVTYTSFNMLDPIVGKNVELRRAISYATDTPALLEKFYNGRGISANSLIPPGVDGYDPDFKNPYKEYNLAKAKEALKKAGYPDGKGLPELEYSTTNSTTARQMAEYFQQNMAAIGIKIKINATSWPQFTDKIRTKKAQIWGIAWSADYPDAENFFQLLYGKNVSPGPNGSNYQSKEFDTLYEKALKLPAGAERTAVYKQMKDLVVKDMPWITNIHRLGYTLTHGWLLNYKRHAIVAGDGKYLRIDTDKKAKLKEKL